MTAPEGVPCRYRRKHGWSLAGWQASLRADCGPDLRRQFEDNAWKANRHTSSAAITQEDAERWLRTYEARHAGSGQDVEPEVVRSWSVAEHDARAVDTSDYRGELLRAAEDGDEYAAWRVGEMFK